MVIPLIHKYDMKIMVRFKGGTGGETVSWFLDSSLNGNADTLKTSENRRIHIDVFNCLHGRTVSNKIIPRKFGNYWDDIPADILKQRFQRIIDLSSKKNPIAKGHHHIMSKDHWSKVFSDWKIIDILPDPYLGWICQTLQFYKGAFTKTTVDVNKKYSKHPQFILVKKFFNKNGWVPEYWCSILNYPERSIYDLDNFFKQNYVKIDSIIELSKWPNNHNIDGSKLLIDTTLCEFYKISNSFEFTISQDVEKQLLEWVNKNCLIFEELGILDKVKSSYKMDDSESESFFRKLFWDKAVRLANGDSS